MTRSDRTRKLRFVGLAVLLLAGTLGATGRGRRGDVYGTVSCNAKPVVWGTVTVIGSDGIPRYAQIGEDGYYEIFDVPTGPTKIAVASPDPEQHYQGVVSAQKDPEAAANKLQAPTVDKTRWFAISKSYQDPYNSGLTYEVKRGNNNFDIALDRTGDADGPPPKTDKEKDKDKKDKPKKDEPPPIEKKPRTGTPGGN